MRTEVEGVRFSTSNYPDEGPSNYNLESSYSYGEPRRKHDDHDGANRVQHLEKDRAELLRKLDELKEQLSRSCDVVELFSLSGVPNGSLVVVVSILPQNLISVKPRLYIMPLVYDAKVKNGRS